MEPLSDILREEVRWYVGGGQGVNVLTFPVLDDDNKTYAVLDVPLSGGRADDDYAGIVVFARIIDDLIVIEQDNTDRPLHKHLLQRGVSASSIICAYIGETIPKKERAEA
jgi:hypothetical protein